MKNFFIAITIALGAAAPACAGFVEGANAYNAKNYAVALKEIIPLAKAGHADAQHLLGLMYYMGRGVVRDYAQALGWHRKAAEQGKADAQYVVGAMYYTGNAIEADPKQAVTWFRKAAEKGHAQAQHALGLMYRYHAAGLPEDRVLAYVLWSLAAGGGNKNSVDQRNAIARVMTPQQINEAETMLRTWKPGLPLPLRSRSGVVVANSS